MVSERAIRQAVANSDDAAVLAKKRTRVNGYKDGQSGQKAVRSATVGTRHTLFLPNQR